MSRPHVFWMDKEKADTVRSGKIDGYVSHERQVCACIRIDGGGFTHVPLADILGDNDPRMRKMSDLLGPFGGF